MTRRRAFGLLMALIGFLVMWAPSARAQAPSTLTVDQANYQPGDTVTFTGTGFLCEGVVGIRLLPPGLQIGIISADETGTFQGTFPAPSVSGTYTLTATNDLCSARTSFTVQGGTDSLTTLTVDQSSYGPGDTVTVTGTGFVCEGVVGIRLLPPGLQIGIISADDTGMFQATFPAPSWSGTYTLTATNDLCSARTSFGVQ